MVTIYTRPHVVATSRTCRRRPAAVRLFGALGHVPDASGCPSEPFPRTQALKAAAANNQVATGAHADRGGVSEKTARYRVKVLKAWLESGCELEKLDVFRPAWAVSLGALQLCR